MERIAFIGLFLFLLVFSTGCSIDKLGGYFGSNDSSESGPSSPNTPENLFNDTTFTPTATTNIEAGSNFKLIASDENERQVQPTETLSQSMAAYWRFNSVPANETTASSVADTVSGTFTGTLVTGSGAADKSVTGVLNAGLDFDGTDDFVFLSDGGVGSALDFDTNDEITISAWINPDTLPTYGLIVSKHTSTTEQFNWALTTNNNSIRFFYRNVGNSGYNAFRQDLDSLETGRWQHVAVTYKFGVSSSARLYVDGWEVEGSWVLGTGGEDPHVNNGEIVIGNANDGISTYPFNGKVDEMIIWRRALSQHEVRLLYTKQKDQYGSANPINVELPNNSLVSGSGAWVDMTNNSLLLHLDDKVKVNGYGIYDYSGNGHIGTLVTSDTLDKNFGGAIGNNSMVFDGSDDYIEFSDDPTLDLTGANHTAMAWIRPNSYGGNTQGRIVDKDGCDTGGGDGWVFRIGNGFGFDAGHTNHLFYGANDCTELAWSNDNVITLGEWQHVAVVYSGGDQVEFFVNGVSSGTTTGVAQAVDDATTLRIGNSTSGTRTFDGTIDEVALWQRALSQAEIQNIYQIQKPQVEKIGNATSGSMISEVFNSNVVDTNWTTLNWVPEAPYGKNILSVSEIETSYNTENAGTSLKAGLIAHWTLDGVPGTAVPTGAGAILDVSGNASHGTATDQSSDGTMVYRKGQNGDTGIEMLDGDNISISGFSTPADISVAVWAELYRKDSTSSIPFTIGDRVGIAFDNDSVGVNGVAGFYYDGAAWRVITNERYGQGQGLMHVVYTFDDTADEQKVYVNGLLVNSETRAASIAYSSSTATIGENPGNTVEDFNGRVDDVAVWNRAITAAEVSQLYRRGAQSVKFQVRSCDDSACSGETFVGPDGTADTFYSEKSNLTVNLPEFSITNLGSGQYFQYQAVMQTQDSSVSPQINSVTIQNDQ